MAKKRKAGDGLIRQRTDGRWEGRYVVGYDDHGYPKTKAVFGKSKRECAEKLAALKTQLGGIPSDKLRPEMRFADWLDYWYETHCKPNIRTSTQSGYEDRIRLHIKPELGEIPLNRLTQNDLQQFYARLKKSRPPSPPERQNVRNRLRQLQEEGKQNSQLKQRKKSQDRDR